MDTVLIPHKKFDKAAINAVGLGIVVSLMFTQNLNTSAKDLGVGNYTGISPSLSFLIENQAKKELEFENSINNKYKGSRIVEV